MRTKLTPVCSLTINANTILFSFTSIIRLLENIVSYLNATYNTIKMISNINDSTR